MLYLKVLCVFRIEKGLSSTSIEELVSLTMRSKQIMVAISVAKLKFVKKIKLSFDLSFEKV